MWKAVKDNQWNMVKDRKRRVWSTRSLIAARVLLLVPAVLPRRKHTEFQENPPNAMRHHHATLTEMTEMRM